MWRIEAGKRVRSRAVALLCLVLLLISAPVAAASLESLPTPAVAAYLDLAEASQRAYDDNEPTLTEMTNGLFALTLEQGADTIVAFRGSVLGDREKRHPFSSLGGKAVRRAYRDWAATNLKQAAGFLPRQYLEAAAFVAARAAALPPGGRLFVTGHSKGGAAAEYATVAAWADPALAADAKARVFCVTFNAAVVRPANWRRLFRAARGSDPDAVRQDLARPGRLVAVTVDGDPVSRLGAEDEPRFGARVVVPAAAEAGALERHGIEAVIAGLRRELARRSGDALFSP